jgi:mRNA interferase HigB
MRVFARRTLREYWKNHSNAEQVLKAWYSEAKHAQWKSPDDIKKKYPQASILPGNRVIFRINGNNYRLVVKINYDYGQVFIRFIGTHAEYDKIDAATV